MRAEQNSRGFSRTEQLKATCLSLADGPPGVLPRVSPKGAFLGFLSKGVCVCIMFVSVCV